jgi:hypothetical protein
VSNDLANEALRQIESLQEAIVVLKTRVGALERQAPKPQVPPAPEAVIKQAVDWPNVSSYTEVCLHGDLAQAIAAIRPMKPLPWNVTLPCGNSFTIQDAQTIPSEDKPCPCGDPNHWMIKHQAGMVLIGHSILTDDGARYEKADVVAGSVAPETPETDIEKTMHNLLVAAKEAGQTFVSIRTLELRDLLLRCSFYDGRHLTAMKEYTTRLKDLVVYAHKLMWDVTPKNAPGNPHWKPYDDMPGLLSQLSNILRGIKDFTHGFVPKATEQPVQDASVATPKFKVGDQVKWKCGPFEGVVIKIIDGTDYIVRNAMGNEWLLGEDSWIMNLETKA